MPVPPVTAVTARRFVPSAQRLWPVLSLCAALGLAACAPTEAESAAKTKLKWATATLAQAPTPPLPVIPPHPDEPELPPADSAPSPEPIQEFPANAPSAPAPMADPMSAPAPRPPAVILPETTPTPTPAPTPAPPIRVPSNSAGLPNTGSIGPTPSAPAQSNLRGLWVDAFGDGLKSPAQVTQMVNDAQDMGINVLFIQAIRRGDCLCLKSGLPVVTDKDYTPNFDALALATTLAQQRGIKVIAWATLTGIANVNMINTDPKHILRQRGPDAGARSWMNRRPDNTWRESNDGWLDPGIPEAAEFMVSGIVNIMKNYPVDGVQLDRIRYPDGGNWGYDPKSLARFRAETGVQGIPAANNPTWQQWKRDQVTALVRRIALEVKSIRPEAWVSAATIVYGMAPAAGDVRAFQKTPTYATVLQDWPTWVREGLVDLNVPMNYKRDDVGDQSKWFDAWNEFAGSVRLRADGQVAPLAIGTAMYLNTPAITTAQARRSIAQGIGWVGYSYRTPTVGVYGNKQTTKQGLADVKKSFAASSGTGNAALMQNAVWNEQAPSVRGLMGRVVGVEYAGSRLVQALQGGQVVATTTTDGNGYYGFLTLPAGKVEIRVSGQRWIETIPERGIVRFPNFLARDFRVLPSTP